MTLSHLSSEVPADVSSLSAKVTEVSVLLYPAPCTSNKKAKKDLSTTVFQRLNLNGRFSIYRGGVWSLLCDKINEKDPISACLPLLELNITYTVCENWGSV